MTQSSLFEVCKALLLSRTDKENGAAFKAHFNDWHHKADEFWVFWFWYVNGILKVIKLNVVARVNCMFV